MERQAPDDQTMAYVAPSAESPGAATIRCEELGAVVQCDPIDSYGALCAEAPGNFTVSNELFAPERPVIKQ